MALSDRLSLATIVPASCFTSQSLRVLGECYERIVVGRSVGRSDSSTKPERRDCLVVCRQWIYVGLLLSLFGSETLRLERRFVATVLYDALIIYYRSAMDPNNVLT